MATCSGCVAGETRAKAEKEKYSKHISWTGLLGFLFVFFPRVWCSRTCSLCCFWKHVSEIKKKNVCVLL